MATDCLKVFFFQMHTLSKELKVLAHAWSLKVFRLVFYVDDGISSRLVNVRARIHANFGSFFHYVLSLLQSADYCYDG